jgi:hypothetical protein
MSELATLALSGVVGAVTGFLAALLRSALDVRVKIDQELRDVRTPLYKELWHEMKIVPLWPRNENLKYGDLQALSGRFRDWYFEGGGIYLSRPSQRRYRELQELLRSLADQPPERGVDPGGKAYRNVQRRCSALRTAMTDDLLSRRGRGMLFPSLPSLRPRRS